MGVRPALCLRAPVLRGSSSAPWRSARGDAVHAALPPTSPGEPENPEETGLGGDVVSYFLGSTHISAIAWLAMRLALCAAETLAPGVFFVWIGASAAIVGVFAYLLPIEFRWQLLLFAVLVVVLVRIGGASTGRAARRPGRAVERDAGVARRCRLLSGERATGPLAARLLPPRTPLGGQR